MSLFLICVATQNNENVTGTRNRRTNSGQTKMDKRTNNDLQNNIHKTNIE
jgi:hypothetical protein